MKQFSLSNIPMAPSRQEVSGNELKKPNTIDSRIEESSALMSARSQDLSKERVDRSRPKKRNQNQWHKLSEKLKKLTEEHNFEKFIDAHQFENLQEALIQII